MRLIGVLVLACVVVGCGDGSPTAPTPTIPVVQGVWSGDYSVVTCTDTGIAGTCAAAGFTPGRVLPIRLTLNQNGQQLSGTAELGSFSLPITGNINASGRMVLNGTATTPVGGIPTSFTIVNWDTSTDGQTMTGQWRTTIAPTGLPGQLVVDNSIRVLTKTG